MQSARKQKCNQKIWSQLQNVILKESHFGSDKNTKYPGIFGMPCMTPNI